jgi:hypothetical protein
MKNHDWECAAHGQNAGLLRSGAAVRSSDIVRLLLEVSGRFYHLLSIFAKDGNVIWTGCPG